MVDPWQVVPSAALTAYRYRREIREAWSDVSRTLRIAGNQVGVAGLPGTGKSVLFDHLSGDGFKPNYQPPTQSSGIEKTRVHGDRFFVIPGQDSAERLSTLDHNIADNTRLAGLVYVVCNGLVQTRRPEARSVVESQVTLDEYCKLQRKREVEDLTEVGRFLRRSVRSKRRKIWIAVVVNKFDLFSGEAVSGAVRSHYQEGESEFTETLSELVDNIGRDNVSLSLWPACGWPEDFMYGSESIPTGFTLEQRAHSVALLSRHLRELTHNVS